MKLRHTMILEETDCIQLIDLPAMSVTLSRDMRSPWVHSSFHESSSNKDFMTRDPAYIKDVKERGMMTACHCFIHKIAIQHEISNSHPFWICKQYEVWIEYQINVTADLILYIHTILPRTISAEILTMWSSRMPYTPNKFAESHLLTWHF